MVLAPVTNLPRSSVLTPYFTEVLKIIFNRLNKDPSESFKRRFVRFYHLVSSRQMQGMGADFLISHTDAVQADIFPPIYLTIILPMTLTLVKPLERKLAVVSLVKTLTDSQAFAVKYVKGWTKTCDALLGLLENAPVLTNEQEVIKEADVDDMSFGVGFTQLNTCKRTASDDWPEIIDVKRWVGEAFKEADSRHNGHIAKFVSERASEQAVAVLASYLK